MDSKKRIFVVAGEPSGDVLGGKLVASLKQLYGEENVEFQGIGGESMEGQGITSLFPMRELSHMGFAEIIPYIPKLLWRIRQTEQAILAFKPDALVTIDSPGFNFRLARRLKGKGIKLIHYVAPTVWAYKPERAAKVAEIFDHLMVILPFEPPYFEKEGMKCTFVGHPVIESWGDRGNGREFRLANGIPLSAPVVCISPGSRPGEIRRHLEVFGQTVEILRRKFPDLCVILPTVRSVRATIEEEVKGWKAPVTIFDSKEKRSAFAASNIAIAKSGTVTLELALAGIPMVVTYKVNTISAWMMRKMILVRFVSLINIISGREIIPELLQEFCKPDLLASEVTKLLESQDEQQRQIKGAREALEQLGLNTQVQPSVQAAEVVLNEIGGDQLRKSRALGATYISESVESSLAVSVS